MNQKVAHAVVHFSGRVQGVGFRYMTLQIAKGFEVRGFVRNLPDGRVLLEVEGEDSEARAFVAELEDKLDSYIRESDVRWSSRLPQFKGFIIAR